MLHACVVAAIVTHAPPSAAPAAVDDDALELDIVTLDQAPAGIAPKAEHPAGGSAVRVGARVPQARAPIDDTAEAMQAVAPPSTGEYTLDPRAPTAAADGAAPRRGVTFDVPWAAPGAGTEEAPPKTPDDPNAKLRRSLDAERDEHDKRLGVGVVSRVGGQVVSAAVPAIRASSPPDGWAVLEIELDAAGHARSVTLAQSSVAGFAASAEAVKAALAATTIELPKSFAGAKVRIKIVSRMQLPNGQTSQVEAQNLFKPSDEPHKENEKNPAPLHQRWWEDALPGLPIWKKLGMAGSGVMKTGTATQLVVVPLFSTDPANIGAKKALSLGVTVVDVVAR